MKARYTVISVIQGPSEFNWKIHVIRDEKQGYHIAKATKNEYNHLCYFKNETEEEEWIKEKLQRSKDALKKRAAHSLR